MPSGCLNSATTANQSAIAPTIDASAPALTKPRKPSCSQREQVDGGGEQQQPDGDRAHPAQGARGARASSCRVAETVIGDEPWRCRTYPVRRGRDTGSRRQGRLGHGVVADQQRRRHARDHGDATGCRPGAAPRAAATSAACGPDGQPDGVQHERAVVLDVDDRAPSRRRSGVSATSCGRSTTSTSTSACPSPGTVETTPISQVSSASWTWAGRKSASPMNDGDEAGRRRLEDHAPGCRPARSRRRASPRPGRRSDSASVWSWVTRTAVVPVSRSTRDRVGADLGAQRLVEAARTARRGARRPAAAPAPGPARPAAARRRRARAGSGSPGRRAGPGRAPRATRARRSPRGEPVEAEGDVARRRRGAGTARGPGRPGRPGGARAARHAPGPATTSPAIAIVPGVGPLQARRPAAAAVDLPQPGGADEGDAARPGPPSRSRSRGGAHGAVRLRDAVAARGAGAGSAVIRARRVGAGRRAGPAGTAGTPGPSRPPRSRSAGRAAFSQKFSWPAGRPTPTP